MFLCVAAEFPPENIVQIDITQEDRDERKLAEGKESETTT